VCGVAAQPGHTKELQTVRLERSIRIIDSPGVVFDDDDHDDGAGSSRGNVLLRNVMKVEGIDDPISVGMGPFCRSEKKWLFDFFFHSGCDRGADRGRGVAEHLQIASVWVISRVFDHARAQ
jgi:hypothetical protein